MSIPYNIDSYETITVNTAIGVTTPAYHNYIFVTVEGDAIRWRCDGSDPSSTVGHLVGAGGSITIEGGQNVTSFRMIKVTSNATARVSLGWREGGQP